MAQDVPKLDYETPAKRRSTWQALGQAIGKLFVVVGAVALTVLAVASYVRALSWLQDNRFDGWLFERLRSPIVIFPILLLIVLAVCKMAFLVLDRIEPRH